MNDNAFLQGYIEQKEYMQKVAGTGSETLTALGHNAVISEYDRLEKGALTDIKLKYAAMLARQAKDLPGTVG